MEVIREKEEFYIIKNGEKAFIKFKVEGNIIIVTTTFVPETLRGKGIAGILNKEIIKFAKEKNFKIYPLCSYTRKYMERENLFHMIHEP